MTRQSPEKAKISKLLRLEKRLQLPMLILSFVWLCVLIAELVGGTNSVLSIFGTVLWLSFVIYFFFRLFTAPSKPDLLKKNWLFILAIFVSVLRFFPRLQTVLVVRGLTATLGIQVIWIFASADQGIRFLRRALGRRGAGYVLVLTTVVVFAGAAGLLHFESASNDADRIQNYPDAVWWTTMQMTNIGSAYSLKTSGGRVLCLAISIYAAGMFGYLTALFAALIIDREVKVPKIEGSEQKDIQEIKAELFKLTLLIENFIKASVPRK